MPDGRLLPLIDVIIDGVGIIICILDSGADYSTFPMRLGQEAHVDFDSAKRETSECAHGHKGVSYKAPMKVTILGEEFILESNFIPDGGEPALLGRIGFFDKFEIVFDELKHEMILRRKQK